MIYITGDTHGDKIRFLQLAKHGENGWDKDDILIICGDFGYIFADDEREHDFLDELAKKAYTICFCDGNHENFAAINAYPEIIWNGGKVHKIRENIFHLMRGQVFEIQGKTFFVMGGAYSIDRYMRVKNRSFWDEELPVSDEYHAAVQNLKAHNNEVDYVITHTAPKEIIRYMGKYPDEHDAQLTGFLEWVMYEVKFKRWFFGHWHIDRQIKDRFYALLFDVVCID